MGLKGVIQRVEDQASKMAARLIRRRRNRSCTIHKNDLGRRSKRNTLRLNTSTVFNPWTALIIMFLMMPLAGLGIWIWANYTIIGFILYFLTIDLMTHITLTIIAKLQQ